MENMTVNQTTVAVRKRICPECEWRTDANRPLAAADALACEKLCALFVHLPRLTLLVAQFGSEPPCGYDNVIDDFLRLARERSAGPSVESEAPLRAYAAEALAVIERVAAPRGGDSTPGR